MSMALSLPNMLLKFWMSLTIILLHVFWSFIASKPGATLHRRTDEMSAQLFMAKIYFKKSIFGVYEFNFNGKTIKKRRILA